jgi:hypothetical protein
MTSESRAILFRVGGLGDLLVALPAVTLVRRALPGFRLTLVGRPEYAELLQRAGLVDDVVAFDDPRIASFFGEGKPFDPSMQRKREGERRRAVTASGSRRLRAGPRASLGGFTLALGWLNRRGDWPDDDSWMRRGVERAFFVPYDEGRSEVMSRFFFDRTLSYLRTSAIGPGAGSPSSCAHVSFDECARLALGRETIERSLAGLGLRILGANERRLVVHPGSGGRAKRWPLRGFIELITYAAELGLGGVFVTGEAEADLEAGLRGWAVPAGWTRAARVAPETLADLLAGSTHYVGNDSGPTHLAAACGASVVAIFRDENLPAWRPFGRTRVLSAPAVERIPLEAVLSALDDFLRA